MRYAMAIDIDRCTGCDACAVACKVENNLPNDIWWNRILTIGGKTANSPKGTFPNLQMQFLPMNCQHCENPPCVKACPVGATYKREDGIVIQDYDKCIGCRYCMVACPYSGVRQFNWKKPEYAIGMAMGDAAVTPHQSDVVEKCNLCIHRVDQGLKPACIETCPNRARIFGDIDDPNSEVSQAIKGRSYVKILEEKGTKPSIFYLT
ncbi:MAG: 4Fe-4S dicluster domain-containing protein [Syntrophomonadaceae bacterium]|nr:4Fe-4S dicluster domain-containing protein [Syntrophomonadaceae bacterium]